MKKRAPIKDIIDKGNALRDAILVNGTGTPPPVVNAASDLLSALGIGAVDKREEA